MVVNELLRRTPRLSKRLTVWVGLPVEYHDLYDEYFDCLRDQVSVRFFATHVEQGDRYFVKLGLVKLLDQLAAKDQFFYLDYDHLVMGPLQLEAEATLANCIQVSSEVKRYGAKISLVDADLVAAIPVNDRYHYNNSLMFSSVATMRQACSGWSEVYHQLDGLAPEQREEIAFCTAAQAAGGQLLPVAFHIQEYFGRASCRSALFHFGGASAPAVELKGYLQERAFEFCWERFTLESLRTEHQRMVAKLTGLLALSA